MDSFESQAQAGCIRIQGVLSVSGEGLVFKQESFLRNMRVCGLIAFGSCLLLFPIGWWCNSIHCHVSIVTRHGNLTLAQGVKVDNWLCIWSAPTCTNTGAWQVKLDLAQGGPVNGQL